MRKDTPHPLSDKTMRIRVMRHIVTAGAERYDPVRHLERLFPGTDATNLDTQPTESLARLSRLKRALRTERRKGRAGHWSYDLNRHIGLLQALKRERTNVRAHRQKTNPADPPSV